MRPAIPKPTVLNLTARPMQPGMRPAAMQPRMTQAKSMGVRAVGTGRPSGVVQRIISGYKAGTTLRVNYVVMKGLSLSQMSKVQDLHDDWSKTYTIDEARAIATGASSSSNKYAWDVTNMGSFVVGDSNMQDVLDHFGHPTSDVVKVYDDLASRVGFDVGKSRKGALTSSTISDLNLHFEASAPLHLGLNPYLHSAWTTNLDDYSGAKTGIPLYSVMRSELTKDFRAEMVGKVDLNAVLKEVSGRPFEVHHVLFKAHHPTFATKPQNLMLTERSPRESTDGPGQHELMHMVASGRHTDKFNQLLPQYTTVYDDWVVSKFGKKLGKL